MPWRLIVFILIFAVFMVFIAFNLENKCDINFGFTKIEQVPVFITIFTSFILGVFCALPLILHIKKKQKDKPPKEKKPKIDDDIPMMDDAAYSDTIDPKAAREKFLAERKKGKK
ncbi:MAG: hypothetical protein FWB73_09445 [Treponema sp.]|nr:hypothetical protein [Treponema sp.]